MLVMHTRPMWKRKWGDEQRWTAVGAGTRYGDSAGDRSWDTLGRHVQGNVRDVWDMNGATRCVNYEQCRQRDVWTMRRRSEEALGKCDGEECELAGSGRLYLVHREAPGQRVCLWTVGHLARGTFAHLAPQCSVTFTAGTLVSSTVAHRNQN